MTEIEFFSADILYELKAHTNDFIRAIEAKGMAVKSVQYAVAPAVHRYTVMVVYGNGPTATQRWSGPRA